MTIIRYLSTLVLVLKKTCAVLAVARAPVRRFVPEGSLTAYDNACDAIMAGCEVIRAIEFADDVVGTTAPWGEK